MSPALGDGSLSPRFGIRGRMLASVAAGTAAERLTPPNQRSWKISISTAWYFNDETITMHCAGVVRNTCLDAFGVVLNQSCCGNDWFSSTKELQLISLQFCAVCRNVATLTLRVDDAIPRRLLAAADASPPGRGRLCTTRVPRLRARRVVWKLPTATELRRPMYALADVTHMHFDWSLLDTLDLDAFEGVQWPRGLYAVKIDDCFDPFHCLTEEDDWPKSPQYMRFNFDQPLWGAFWPASLRRLALAGGFNRPVVEVVWPTSLEQLAFGENFDQPIEGVVWPPSLKQLTFEKYFNQPLDRVVWPKCLEQLDLGDDFNQFIEGVVWPTSLQQLTFGEQFNLPIEEVLWPRYLQRLTFGYFFNQPVEKAKWPVSLQILTFGDSFDQPIDRVEWPNSLRQLSLGEDFNRLVDDVIWPTSLEGISIKFGYRTFSLMGGMGMYAYFNHSTMGGARWPESLRQLTVSGMFMKSCWHVDAWMPNLEEFILLLEDPSSYHLFLRGIEWSGSLRKLTVFEDASLDGVTIPQQVQVVRRARCKVRLTSMFCC